MTSETGAENPIAGVQRNMDSHHALISSAKHLGEATGVLPVVSTLSFGFAASGLLGQKEADHPPAVLVLLSLSACFSMYTTVYSVLEFYYIAMLTASDTKSNYLDLNDEKLDQLGRRVDGMIITSVVVTTSYCILS